MFPSQHNCFAQLHIASTRSHFDELFRETTSQRPSCDPDRVHTRLAADIGFRPCVLVPCVDSLCYISKFKIYWFWNCHTGSISALGAYLVSGNNPLRSLRFRSIPWLVIILWWISIAISIITFCGYLRQLSTTSILIIMFAIGYPLLALFEVRIAYVCHPNYYVALLMSDFVVACQNLLSLI